jgi:hypothetical protein
MVEFFTSVNITDLLVVVVTVGMGLVARFNQFERNG